MNIFIDGSKRAAIKRLIPAWKKMGHKVVGSPKEADVQLSVVRIRHKTGIPVVLRIDGVYYDKGRKYKRANSALSRSHRQANAIIYQSNCSKMMCEMYLSKRTTEIFKVIHNGIDPTGWNNPKKHKHINVMSCSKWRRPKRLPEMIQVFNDFLKYYPNATLHIIGKFKKGGRKLPHPKVVYHGLVDFTKMIEIYKAGDVYLHLCKRDSCPSTVTEAIAAGIPVITTNACGGATEMCNLTEGCEVVEGESESLEPVFVYKSRNNNFYNFPKHVRKKIMTQMVKIVREKRRVVLPEKLTIKYVAAQYIDVMKEAIKTQGK